MIEKVKINQLFDVNGLFRSFKQLFDLLIVSLDLLALRSFGATIFVRVQPLQDQHLREHPSRAMAMYPGSWTEGKG